MSIARISATRGSGENFKLFEALKQALEGVKTLTSPNNKLGEKPKNNIRTYVNLT